MARIMITGGASGIGREAAIQMAAQGHDVMIADRDFGGGEGVVRDIRAAGGRAEMHQLDLGDLAGIQAFAAMQVARGLPIDALVNNAGLLPPIERAVTRDGFELGFGISYLGHFALTGLLLPAMLRSAAPRVVAVSSLSHSGGRIDLDDLQVERDYTWSKAYAASKLACLLFARELHRRVSAQGGKLVSVAAHPGISRTPIGANQTRTTRPTLKDRVDRLAYEVSTRLLGQTAAEGAAPLVHAAIAAGVRSGAYYGPTRFLQARGPVGEVKPGKPALDTELGERLFARSEELSGVRFGMMV